MTVPARGAVQVPGASRSGPMQKTADQSLGDVLHDLLQPEYDVMQLDLKGLRVLVRADLNVPLDAANNVADKSRVEGVLPTLKQLAAKGAKVIVASHMGRPEPKKQSHDEMTTKFSLAPVDKLLTESLGDDTYIGMANDCVGDAVAMFTSQLKDGQVCLLENTRFHAGDTGNDPAFAQQLAQLCDLFVDDAFGVIHRDQASVTGITKFVTECYPGPLVRKELTYLLEHLDTPKRPLGVVIGGAKVADKIGVISALISKADKIFIGGRMAFTFLAAQGVEIGKTQVEEAWLKPSLQMIEAAKQAGCQLVLPHDIVVAESLLAPDAGQPIQIVPLKIGCCTQERPCVPAGKYGVDIGPASAKTYADGIKTCATVFWNGPMGIFEIPEFAHGTESVANAMAEAFESGAVTVVGGGDSVSAINQLGLSHQVTHISTGGGASLELIEGKGMPGLRALVGKFRQAQ